MPTIPSYIQSRSSYWFALNTSTILFDIDFVTGNVINMDVNSVSITPVPFDTDHKTTIDNLVLAISNISSVQASLVSADQAYRTIKLQGLTNTLVSVGNIVVTGGAEQATATIIPSRYNDLVTIAQQYVADGCLAAKGLSNYAVALIIMHWLTLEANSGGTGNAQNGKIKGKKEGDLAITYGSGSDDKAGSYWGSTAYGQEFYNLKQTFIIGVRNRMTCGC